MRRHLGSAVQMLSDRKCTSVKRLRVLIFTVIDVASYSAEFRLFNVTEEGKEIAECKCEYGVLVSLEEMYV